MLLFKKKQLDERQLLIRGNIFKHGLFIMSILIFCNSMLNMFLGFEWASDRWSELTIILFTVTVCCVEFICYDIYPFTEKRQKHLIYFMGFFGVVSICLCLYEMITLKIAAIVDGKLSSDVLGVLYGCMFLSIFLTYICKAVHNKKIEMED